MRNKISQLPVAVLAAVTSFTLLCLAASVPAQTYPGGAVVIDHEYAESGRYAAFLTVSEPSGLRRTPRFAFVVGSAFSFFAPAMLGGVFLAGLVFAVGVGAEVEPLAVFADDRLRRAADAERVPLAYFGFADLVAQGVGIAVADEENPVFLVEHKPLGDHRGGRSRGASRRGPAQAAVDGLRHADPPAERAGVSPARRDCRGRRRAQGACGCG